jgi:hypothetical protein
VKRPRTNLIVPKTPGGFLDDPPGDCPNRVFYCPDVRKYETIPVVDYARCDRKYCPLPRICQRRLEADKGRRHRISNGTAPE